MISDGDSGIGREGDVFFEVPRGDLSDGMLQSFQWCVQSLQLTISQTYAWLIAADRLVVQIDLQDNRLQTEDRHSQLVEPRNADIYRSRVLLPLDHRRSDIHNLQVPRDIAVVKQLACRPEETSSCQFGGQLVLQIVNIALQLRRCRLQSIKTDVLLQSLRRFQSEETI